MAAAERVEILCHAPLEGIHGGTPASAEEQAILAKYTGWGGLPDVFDPVKSAWSQEYTQLKELLTET